MRVIIIILLTAALIFTIVKKDKLDEKAWSCDWDLKSCHENAAMAKGDHERDSERWIRTLTEYEEKIKALETNRKRP